MDQTKPILFQVENHHVTSCGTPPEWTRAGASKSSYRFYGENEHGEQMVIDVTKEKLMIAMGDLGWDRPIIIENPDYADIGMRFWMRIRGTPKKKLLEFYENPKTALDRVFLTGSEAMLVMTALELGARRWKLDLAANG